jgi:hypothetical protein
MDLDSNTFGTIHSKVKGDSEIKILLMAKGMKCQVEYVKN